jgi:hypothetical protein
MANSRRNEHHGQLKPPSARGATKVKVAVSDVDGILRGKYLHIDKFAGALEGGFGFCDVVLGWDAHDQCYDNTQVTGWHHGFPDALARLDPSTARRVPWDGNVPFFLGEFVNADGSAHPVCPRQVLKRVLARARKLGFEPMCGVEFEWFNFAETPQSWAGKRGVGPETITPGMFGYSLLRMADQRGFFNALMDDMLAFGVPIEGLHTETGPGVYEVALQFCDALESADRAILFKTGAKEIGKRFGVMPSFMAKWSQQFPGCSGHIHQSLSDGKTNLFYDAKSKRSMSRLFDSYLAGPAAGADAVRADVLAHGQQLQAPGRRLLGACQAHLGPGQPHRQLSRHRRQPQGHAPGNTLPRRRHQPVPRDGRGGGRRHARRREGAQAHHAADHRHQPGRREHSARAALADRDDAHLPGQRHRPRLVRRRVRRPLRRHPGLGVAPVAGRGDRLGAQKIL